MTGRSQRIDWALMLLESIGAALGISLLFAFLALLAA